MVVFISTITELRIQAQHSVVNTCFIVGGYHTYGDGGGGTFILKKNPTLAQDNGIIIYSDHYGTTGNNAGLANVYYRRVTNCPYYSVKWFGARADGFHDDSDAILDAIYCNRGYGLPLYETNAANTYSRTRIYFPAGVYIVNKELGQLVPQAVNWNPGSYHSNGRFIQYGHSLEIFGDRAILKAGLNFPANGTCLAVQRAWNTKITGLTFKGFPYALYIGNIQHFDNPVHENLDSADSILENLNFSDISRTALTVYCFSGLTKIRNVSYRNCSISLDQIAGQTYHKGGFFNPKKISAHNGFAMKLLFGESMVVEDTVFKPPKFTATGYANSYAWHKLASCVFIGSNVKYLPSEGINLQVGHIITNENAGGIRLPGGLTEGGSLPASILKDSLCNSSGETMGLLVSRIPDGVVFEHNYGFVASKAPLLGFLYPTYQVNFSKKIALFSLKMDNVPFGGQANNIWAGPLTLTNSFQLGILPFIRINTGQFSFGCVDKSVPTYDTDLIFFLGRPYAWPRIINANPAIYPNALTSAGAFNPSFDVRMYTVATPGIQPGNQWGSLSVFSEIKIYSYREYAWSADPSYPRPDPYGIVNVTNNQNIYSGVIKRLSFVPAGNVGDPTNWETLFLKGRGAFLQHSPSVVIFYQIKSLTPFTTTIDY